MKFLRFLLVLGFVLLGIVSCGSTQCGPRNLPHHHCTDADGDGFCQQADCDDGNVAVHPGAAEVCNGIDDNCNGQVDEVVKTQFFADLDGDGYGSLASGSTMACMLPPSGYSASNDDCDDNNDALNPGAVEVCDGQDNDCNGLTSASCGIDLNSIPQYDGNFSEWRDGEYNFKELRVCGLECWGARGISDYRLADWQSGFVTFDTNQFEGDWDKIRNTNLRVYANFIIPTIDYPPIPQPVPDPPDVIEVRLWELYNDYSQVANCFYSSHLLGCSTYLFGGCDYHITQIPADCQFPSISYHEILFELVPMGDGWYELATEEDKLLLRQTLEDHSGEKVTFWLDYDTDYYYIMGETPEYDPRFDQKILAPPTLSIDYSE